MNTKILKLVVLPIIQTGELFCRQQSELPMWRARCPRAFWEKAGVQREPEVTGTRAAKWAYGKNTEPRIETDADRYDPLRELKAI